MHKNVLYHLLINYIVESYYRACIVEINNENKTVCWLKFLNDFPTM